MDSLKESQRQIRLAIVALGIIIPTGVLGFLLFEKLSVLNAIWLTIITLTTIGYGDIYARTDGGRVFTIFLILVGLGAVAYGLQASATVLLSPAIRDLRQRRRAQRAIDRLRHHYIICGQGELVDHTVNYLLEGAKQRQTMNLEHLNQPIEKFWSRILGSNKSLVFRFIAQLSSFPVRAFYRTSSLLDVVVVVTPTETFANRLRENGFLVVTGDPTVDEVLIRAGVRNASALMVMLDNDTEAILSVLTARSLNPQLEITAAVLDDQLAHKMIRVGANGVVAHYDVAGRFLNNATLRPAVNDFFTSILFSQENKYQATQLFLLDSSPWIHCSIGALELGKRFQADVIGLRLESGLYDYVPDNHYVLQENEVLIVAAPIEQIHALQEECHGTASSKPQVPVSQRLPLPLNPTIVPGHPKTLEDSLRLVTEMSRHFIICGDGRVARHAINKLDPSRPFVIICDNSQYVQELLESGFLVVQGNPSSESVLRQAGADRALAIMITADDSASSILTVLNCRALSKSLLIVATTHQEDMIPKLRRAGADRVVTPFQVAARFVLLATTRPAVSDFLQFVLYNRQVGIETTELYMQNDSPWIGRSIGSLELNRLFKARAIGLRLADGQYGYAPPATHILRPYEVLIVVTPMECSDELRNLAHGSVTKRPESLRSR
jgi:voltage-gated potassium channel